MLVDGGTKQKTFDCLQRGIKLLRARTREIELLYAGEDDLSDCPEYAELWSYIEGIRKVMDAIKPCINEYERRGGAEVVDLATYLRRADRS